MAKLLSGSEQAQRLFLRYMDRRGWSKEDQRKAASEGYRSEVTLARRTADLGRSADRIFEREGVSRIRDISPDMARAEVQFLKEAGYASSTISGYSKALSDAHQLIHGNPIDYGSLVPSRSSDIPTSGRAYSGPQIREIIEHQPPVFGLMTEVAHNAGLRPSELNGIRPVEEFPIHLADHRLEQLVDYRFSGKDGVDYAVTGKGGLDRTVRLSPELSDQLEIFRLEVSREVESFRGEDNRVFEQHYDFPSAEEWARNFSETSNELFGWSNGAYGLRHSYAQERMKDLQEQGYTWDQSRLAVSQELGHFRPSEVNTYLR